MEFDVGRIVSGSSLTVTGASYIGKPVRGTAMYCTKKVQHLLRHLEDTEDCLIFAKSGMSVPDRLLSKHCFVFTDNPQLAYTEFAKNFIKEKEEREKSVPYIHVNGAYVSKTAEIAEGMYIEPGCVIGPDVVIGRDARILAGSIIRNAEIGAGFVANEHSVIGANGFTMAIDEQGNRCRIPSLGKVRIGDDVEIGAHDNISRGSAGDTVIEDHVKVDALVHIGHDAFVMRNVEITSGCVVGGFDIIEENAYIGLNAVIRNRVRIGKDAFIGMGSIVTKDVPPGFTMIGNPARRMVRG